MRTWPRPELGSVPGFLGAELLSRELHDGVEFTVLSRWESLDAIRTFADDSVERAVVEPGAVRSLRDFDQVVSHHEVVVHVAGDEPHTAPSPRSESAAEMPYLAS